MVVILWDIYLNKNDVLYINVGGRGEYGQNGGTGGYNGGGTQTAGGAGTYSAGTFGQGGSKTNTQASTGGGGCSSNLAGGGGSGYIGNSSLINKAMYCYNCKTSSDSQTLTNSTTNVSENPISQYAKIGNGYVKITYIGTEI